MCCGKRNAVCMREWVSEWVWEREETNPPKKLHTHTTTNNKSWMHCMAMHVSAANGVVVVVFGLKRRVKENPMKNCWSKENNMILENKECLVSRSTMRTTTTTTTETRNSNSQSQPNACLPASQPSHCVSYAKTHHQQQHKNATKECFKVHLLVVRLSSRPTVLSFTLLCVLYWFAEILAVPSLHCFVNVDGWMVGWLDWISPLPLLLLARALLLSS